MKEKVSIFETNEEQFKENAKVFYRNCKKVMRMPYQEGVFVETVCAVSALLRKGEKPKVPLIEEIARNPIKEMYPDMLIKDIKKDIRGIFYGEGTGYGPCWQWINYCWEYRHKLRQELWVEDHHKISAKEDKLKMHEFTRFQRDISILVLTIDTL